MSEMPQRRLYSKLLKPYECNHVFRIFPAMLFRYLPRYLAVSRDALKLEFTAMATWRSVSFPVREAKKLADLTGVESDLISAENICDRFVVESLKEPLDWHLLEIICAAAIIKYGRTFPSGVRSGVATKLVNKLSMEHQGSHQFFKDLRDKWIAHSVNSFEENEVTAWLMPPERGPLGVTGISVRQHRVSSLSVEDIRTLKSLCQAVREVVKEAIAIENQLVLNIAQALPPERFYSQVDPPVKLVGKGNPAKSRSQQ
jgi:hypothetical protein